jgi:hypothetical protein
MLKRDFCNGPKDTSDLLLRAGLIKDGQLKVERQGGQGLSAESGAAYWSSFLG